MQKQSSEVFRVSIRNRQLQAASIQIESLLQSKSKEICISQHAPTQVLLFVGVELTGPAGDLYADSEGRAVAVYDWDLSMKKVLS